MHAQKDKIFDRKLHGIRSPITNPPPTPNPPPPPEPLSVEENGSEDEVDFWKYDAL